MTHEDDIGRSLEVLGLRALKIGGFAVIALIVAGGVLLTI